MDVRVKWGCFDEGLNRGRDSRAEEKEKRTERASHPTSSITEQRAPMDAPLPTRCS